MKKLLFLSLLAFAACKKTDDTTPTGASNGGESYLSCKINGKQYTFTGKPVGLNPDGVSYHYFITNDIWNNFFKKFSVSGDDLGKQYAQVYVELSTGSNSYFPLNTRINFSEQAQKQVYVLLRSPVDFGNSYYYAAEDGWINISRADSIGAGTFAFTAYGFDNNGNRVPGGDSVIVTDGKFDIHN